MSHFPGLPVQASTFAPEVDNIYIFMLAVSLFFTVLVVGLVIYFSIKYRKRDERMPEAVHGNLLLEIVWSGIPLLITVFMFGWGVSVYFKEMRIPDNAMDIFVVGKQWMWKIQHGEGPREMNELHVPINTPIKLTITSEDVIHSFFMPAFRIKSDAVPGKYTFAWFQATKTGTFHLFCAEFCGTKHSEMIGSIVVMEEAKYKNWLAERIKNPTAAVVLADANTHQNAQVALNSTVTQNIVTLSNDGTLEEHGKKLFSELKCNSCHSATSGSMGPDLAGLFGKKVILDNGQTTLANETYIRESILTPSEKMVQGYNALMPTYKGQVDEEQILALVTYIKGLKSDSDSSHSLTK